MNAKHARDGDADLRKLQRKVLPNATAPAFLDVRTAVLNDTVENAVRQRHPGFRLTNDDCKPTVTAT